jgi:hypothetical protein
MRPNDTVLLIALWAIVMAIFAGPVASLIAHWLQR